MKRSRQWIRFGLIAAASFVLLVTVLPQVASGIGLHALGARLAASTPCGSGGSGSSSSSSQCPGGTLTGTVTVKGGPAGFAPAYLGAGACPATTMSGVACANPVYALAVGNSYSLSLSAGTWEVSGFYENSGYGGVFLSPAKQVTVPSGGTVTANFVVAYQGPATVRGTVKVTGVPAGVTIFQLSVLLCPSFAPYTGGNPSIACVTAYTQYVPGVASSTYELTGLPPGMWTAFPSYCTEFGCSTNALAGKVVHLASGHVAKANVKTPFIVPGEGLLSATVTVTGAPAGFADPVAVSACQVGGGGSCQTYSSFGTQPIPLLLSDGQWTVTGLYLAAPFDNPIDGPPQTVTVLGGQTIPVNLDVPYQVLGTASGVIRVTGNLSHIPVTSYTVVACPSSVAGQSSPECINEYSGPSGFGLGSSLTTAARSARGAARAGFDLYQITTLTAGSWTLYPGYGTAFGSYSDPVGTKVTISAGQTTTQKLKVAFQAPSVGLVEGKVEVVGAPANGFQSGVEACSAPSAGLACADGQEAFTQNDGSYSLTLAPGNWWLSGFAFLFTSVGFGQSTTPSQEITIVPGSQLKRNFIVKVAAP